MANVKSGLIGGIIAFITYGILPLGGNYVAKHFGIYLVLFDSQFLLQIGALMAVFVYMEKAYEKDHPFVGGFGGFFKALIALWYFLVFLTMIEHLTIPAISVEISVHYNLIKDLTIFSIGLYALKNLYLMIFGSYLREEKRKEKEKAQEEIIISEGNKSASITNVGAEEN